MKDNGDKPANAIDCSVLETSSDSEANEREAFFREAPCTHDFLHIKNLEFQSLTCEWLPPALTIPRSLKVRPRRGVSGKWHRILVGTQETNSPNYLKMIGTFVPDICQPFDLDSGSLADGEFGGFECPDNYSRDELSIPHCGEVNRVRSMPQMQQFVATKSTNSEVCVFNLLTDRSNIPEAAIISEFVLVGHDKGGFGLDWNLLKEFHLASGSDDGNVCVWDLRKNLDSRHQTTPISIRRISSDSSVVDVRWHRYSGDLFISVGKDSRIFGWDIRSPDQLGAFVVRGAHGNGITALDISPLNEFLFLTGGADKLINLWDLRCLDLPLTKFKAHENPITQVCFSPFDPNIFASGCVAGKAILWDMNRTIINGDRMIQFSNGSEAIFLHRGHSNKINDLQFNKDARSLFCSVSTENDLQIWRPTAFALRPVVRD